MVPPRLAQSSAVGSPRRPCRRALPRHPPPPRPRHSRARTGPCRPGRRSVRPLPARCTGPAPRGVPRDSVGVAERDHAPGRSRSVGYVWPYETPVTGRDSLGQRHPVAGRIAGRNPNRARRRPGRGRRSPDPDGPGRSGCPGGSAGRPSSPGGVAAGESGPLTMARPSWKRASCRSMVGWPGARVREVAPHADHLDLAVGLRLRRRLAAAADQAAAAPRCGQAQNRS